MFEGRVQRSYQAMNRKDLDAVMQGWAEDGVMVLGGRTGVSGRYEGKAAIGDCFARIFARLDEIELTVQHVGFTNPIGLTIANTMFVAYHVRERDHEGQSCETDAIAVLRLRGGKTVRMTEYWLDPAAGEAIWGQRPDADARRKEGAEALIGLARTPAR